MMLLRFVVEIIKMGRDPGRPTLFCNFLFFCAPSTARGFATFRFVKHFADTAAATLVRAVDPASGHTSARGSNRRNRESFVRIPATGDPAGTRSRQASPRTCAESGRLSSGALSEGGRRRRAIFPGRTHGRTNLKSPPSLLPGAGRWPSSARVCSSGQFFGLRRRIGANRGRTAHEGVQRRGSGGSRHPLH